MKFSTGFPTETRPFLIKIVGLLLFIFKRQLRTALCPFCTNEYTGQHRFSTFLIAFQQVIHFKTLFQTFSPNILELKFNSGSKKTEAISNLMVNKNPILNRLLSTAGVSKLRPAGRMRSSRAYNAAHDDFARVNINISLLWIFKIKMYFLLFSDKNQAIVTRNCTNIVSILL